MLHSTKSCQLNYIKASMKYVSTIQLFILSFSISRTNSNIKIGNKMIGERRQTEVRQ